MFVLPVKVKWLALLQWIGYGFIMLSADWVTSIMATAAVFNFFLFFGREIYHRARSGHGRMSRQVKRIAERDKPRHTCSVCNATNLTHPSLHFRYCSKCPGTPCFCEEHLAGHKHEEAS